MHPNHGLFGPVCVFKYLRNGFFLNPGQLPTYGQLQLWAPAHPFSSTLDEPLFMALIFKLYIFFGYILNQKAFLRQKSFPYVMMPHF